MLTDAKIKSLRPRDALYRVTDAAGLCLEIAPSGSRLWRFRYRYAGKAKMLSLGPYPDVTLANAREKRDSARRLLVDGHDPSATRKADKQAAATAAANNLRAVAEEWLELQRPRLAPATYAKSEWLLGLIYSHLGAKAVSSVTPGEILVALRVIEADGRHETAHRVKMRLGQVFRYAIATGRAESDPTYALRGALAPVVTKKRAAVTDPAGIRDLLLALDDYTGLLVTKCALRLAPLVFVRPGELRAAEWSEFHLDGSHPEWRIPAHKMKSRAEHVVPLSAQAVAILRELHPLTGHGALVFPSTWSVKKPMSENTINMALRRLGFDSATHCAHGFRALASTRLNEMGYPPDVIERQLAHAPRDKVRAAYNRAEHLPERRAMMTAWADYLDALRVDTAGKIAPLRRKVAA